MLDAGSGGFRFHRETGEDFPRLARLAFDTAKVHCGTCRDYHLMWPWLRAFGANGGGPEMAWTEQLGAIVRIIAGRPAMRWLIAGSADAGQLALAHAAIRTVPPARHEITIIDRCETPLALCRDHAASVGLDVETVNGDLWTFPRPAAFDVVLMHHLLLFVPVEEHASFVRRIAGHLAPGGKICMVATVQTGAAGATTTATLRRWREGVIRDDVAAGTVAIPEDVETFVARLDGMRRGRTWPAAYGIEHDRDLLLGAGLDVIETILLPTDDPRIPRGAGGAFRARHVLVAERRA
ncbi:MAG: class I SAM-dependent methyltransferase [Bauldia sp.]